MVTEHAHLSSLGLRHKQRALSTESENWCHRYLSLSHSPCHLVVQYQIAALFFSEEITALFSSEEITALLVAALTAKLPCSWGASRCIAQDRILVEVEFGGGGLKSSSQQQQSYWRGYGFLLRAYSHDHHHYWLAAAGLRCRQLPAEILPAKASKVSRALTHPPPLWEITPKLTKVWSSERPCLREAID